MSLLAQKISFILVEIGHDGRICICAKSEIWDEISENDHTSIRHYRHTHIYQTIKDTNFIL